MAFSHFSNLSCVTGASLQTIRSNKERKTLSLKLWSDNYQIMQRQNKVGHCRYCDTHYFTNQKANNLSEGYYLFLIEPESLIEKAITELLQYNDVEFFQYTCSQIILWLWLSAGQHSIIWLVDMSWINEEY